MDSIKIKPKVNIQTYIDFDDIITINTFDIIIIIRNHFILYSLYNGET